MNAAPVFAQSIPSRQPTQSPTEPIRLEKPADGRAVTLHLAAEARLDLGDIAADTITLVRLGDTLVILFDNNATIALDPFFDADGRPRSGLAVHLGDGRDVSAAEFAALFPVTTDTSVLPAAGDAPPAGAYFQASNVDALGGGSGPLALLDGESGNNGTFTAPSDVSVNHAPTAFDDVGQTIESGVGPGNAAFAGTPVASGDVLANDIDTDPNDRLFVVGVAAGAAPGGAAGGVGQAIIGLFGTIVIGADGLWTYTLDNAGAATQALAKDAHGFDVFTYTIRDVDGATSTATLTIDILGTNDRPVILGGATSALTELADTTASAALDTVTGTLAFADVDTPDSHQVGVALAQAQWSGGAALPAGAPATLAAAMSASIATESNGATGTVGWTFALADQTIDFLAAGETLTATYDVTVTDSNGASWTEQVAVTLTGTNDKPQIAAAGIGALDETAGTTGSPQAIATFGTLAFADVDLGDVGHTATVTGLAIGGNDSGLGVDTTILLSWLNIANVAKASGDSDGSVDWNFSAPDKTFDYLADRETLTLTYTVEVDDGDGGTATNTVTITVTGSNDRPEIVAAAASGAIIEDRSDELLTNGGFEAGMSGWNGTGASALTLASYAHSGNRLGYVYGDLNQTVSTGAGIHYTLTFWQNPFYSYGTVKVLFDGVLVGEFGLSGSVSYQMQSVDIVGTGTASVLSFQIGDGAYVFLDDISLQQDLDPHSQTTRGAISFTDADFNDVHLASYTAQNSGQHTDGTNYLGSLTLGAVTESHGGTGTLTWTFDVDRADLQFLAEGQTYQQFYDVRISDGNGGTITQTVTVALTGSNDAPTVDAHGVTLAYSEKQAATAIDNAVTLSDVDGTTLSGAKVWISGNFLAGQDVLGFVNQNGITGSYNASTGVLTLSGTSSLANYEAALRSVTYFNSSSNPSTAPRTVSFQVDDGAARDNASAVATATVAIGPENDAPTITSSPWSVGVTEDASLGTLPELVRNGSFEADSGVYPYPPVDWTYAGYFYHPPGSVGVVHSGGAALGVYTYQSTTGGSASQTVTTAIGETYRIEFYLEKESYSAWNSVTVTWNGQVIQSIVNQTTYGIYTRYAIDVVATQTTSQLLFNFVSGAQGYWFLDDVSVQAVATPSAEARSGSITFADPDTADTHSVSIVNDISGYVGQFTYTLADSTGSGIGQVNWSFAVDDSAIQYLGAGETRTQTYTIKIDDGHGGTALQDVTVTVNGVNDAPTAVADTIVINGYTGTPPGTATSTPIFNETENNDTFVNANPVSRTALAIAPNGNLTDAGDPAITVHGTIGAETDRDYYRIELKAGETIVLDIDNSTDGLDSHVHLYDSVGTQVAANDDASSSGVGGGGSTTNRDSYLTYTATADGLYFIQVHSYNLDSIGSYDLEVSIDNFKGLQGDPVTIPTAVLLANDTDIDGDTFSVIGVSGAGVSLAGDTITVQPGVTSFAYMVSDGVAQSTATVSVSQIAGGTNTGTSGADSLIGGNAADTLSGLLGDDLLFGGGGDDILIGSLGADDLYGGTGADTFRWLAGDLGGGGGGGDHILDLETGAGGDILDLSGLLAGVAGDKADHVRLVYAADGFAQSLSATAGHGVDGDVTIQVDLAGNGTWADVATLHDTGANLTAGDQILKLMLDATQLQVHV